MRDYEQSARCSNLREISAVTVLLPGKHQRQQLKCIRSRFYGLTLLRLSLRRALKRVHKKSTSRPARTHIWAASLRHAAVDRHAAVHASAAHVHDVSGAARGRARASGRLRAVPVVEDESHGGGRQEDRRNARGLRTETQRNAPMERNERERNGMLGLAKIGFPVQGSYRLRSIL